MHVSGLHMTACICCLACYLVRRTVTTAVVPSRKRLQLALVAGCRTWLDEIGLHPELLKFDVSNVVAFDTNGTNDSHLGWSLYTETKLSMSAAKRHDLCY